MNVIPWDPDEIDRIYVEVDDADTDSFQESVDQCNIVYLQICEEKGIEPIKAAVVYDEKNTEREKWAAEAADKSKAKKKTKKAKGKKKAPKKNAKRNTAQKKKQKRAVRKSKSDEDDNENDNEPQGLPLLEPINEENQNDDEDLSEV